MLHGFIQSLQGRLSSCELANSAIEEWITELERITREDTYVEQKTTHFKSGSVGLWNKYPNREAAAAAITYLRYRKADNELRMMPLDERVPRMMDCIEGRHSFGPGTSSYLEGDLTRLGQSALPLLVKRAPTSGLSVEPYLRITRGIGGPEAIKFLVRVSKDRANDSWIRCDALTAAATLEGGREIKSVLIEFLRDDTVLKGSSCARQSSFGDSDHEPCLYQSFPLRSCAATALTQMTGKNWGPVFNEDYSTWKAWSESANPEQFHPFMAARNEAEMKELASVLLNRAVEYRTGPWNSPCQESEATIVGRQLGELGTFGVSALVEYFHSRAPMLGKQTAVENLKVWIGSVLEAIDTPEAQAAQEVIDGFPAPDAPP